MEVSLSYNSWHVKLYRWTTGREPQFKNLCPYFWTTLFFMVASPFVAIVKLSFNLAGALLTNKAVYPFIERNIIDGETRWKLSEKAEKRLVSFGRGVYWSLIVVILLCLLFSLGVLIFKGQWLLFLVKLVCWFLAIVTLVFVFWLSNRISETDTYKFLSEGFLMVWHKVCPAIDWTGKPAEYSDEDFKAKTEEAFQAYISDDKNNEE